MTDFTFNQDHSVVLITPNNNIAWTFIHKNVYYEDWQLVGLSIAVEPRLAQDILWALIDEGMSVDGHVNATDAF